MDKPYKRSLKDHQAIQVDEHDDRVNAKRVIIVGGDIDVIAQGIKDSLSEGLKDIKIEMLPQKDTSIVTKIERIEVPVLVKEVQIVELPHITRELEVKVIEVPVIVKEYEKIEIPVVQKVIEYVEKPIFVEKLVQQDLGYMKYVLIAQVILMIIIALKH